MIVKTCVLIYIMNMCSRHHGLGGPCDLEDVVDKPGYITRYPTHERKLESELINFKLGVFNIFIDTLSLRG